MVIIDLYARCNDINFNHSNSRFSGGVPFHTYVEIYDNICFLAGIETDNIYCERSYVLSANR